MKGTPLSEIGGLEVVTEKEVIRVGTKFNSCKDGRISILSLSVNSEDTLSLISSNTKLIVSGVGD